jgi:hypothetical protein
MTKTKIKSREYVKINKKGKVVLSLTRTQGMVFKPMLEGLMITLADVQFGIYLPVWTYVYLQLIEELYHKYYAELDIVKDAYQVTLTRAQAAVLWDLYQSTAAVNEDVLNIVFLQIHQKLS